MNCQTLVNTQAPRVKIFTNAKETFDLQKLVYVSEAEIINDFTIPPLHQKIDSE